MVLGIRPPQGPALVGLVRMLPSIAIYAFSFVFLGIYWNSHHHLFQAARRVNGRILWANLHFLFWLSLMPLAAVWLGENYAAPVPTAVYGALMLMAGVASRLLLRAIVSAEGPDSAIAKAVGRDRKGLVSVLFCLFGVGLALVQPWAADALFVLVAAMWFVPDLRMEKALHTALPENA
jgi:uncharacterized membrane protein